MEESNRAAERLAHESLIKIVDELAVQRIEPTELVVRAGNRHWDIELRIRPAKVDGAGKKVKRTPCERDILDTLKEVGHNLTTSELTAEMESRKCVHGASTIRNSLARLVRQGVLGNSTESPRGYHFLQS